MNWIKTDSDDEQRVIYQVLLKITTSFNELTEQDKSALEATVGMWVGRWRRKSSKRCRE